MAIEIKHRYDSNKVLYTAENAQDVRAAVLEAVEKKVDLRGAYLGGAYLRGANLRGAYLGGADLGGADLRGADLGGANLGGAYLRGANLGGAYLGGADLRGADLRGANLGGADLRGANLGGAYLGGAYLGGAYLGGADLGGAYLGGAYLRGADLGGAYLGGADLGDAYLRDAYLRGAYLRGADGHRHHPLYLTRQDVFAVLDEYPAEVAGMRVALIEGQINGSCYSGDNGACLVGTLCKVRGVDVWSSTVQRDSMRPAEQWFMAISPGDSALGTKPEEGWPSEGVYRASTALRWVDEWTESRTAVARALSDGGAKAVSA